MVPVDQSMDASEATHVSAMATTTTVTRAYASFEPTWQRFDRKFTAPLTANNDDRHAAAAVHPYGHQYSHIYTHRLAALRDRCLASAARAASTATTKEPPVVVSRVIDLRETLLSTVVGTLVKDMPDRPPVNTSYHSSSLTANSYLGTSFDAPNVALPPLRSFCNMDKDTLVLEDESGRVELLTAPNSNGSALDVNAVATGVVVAVTGVVQPHTGIMIVHSVHFPDVAAETMGTEKSGIVRGASYQKCTEECPYIMFLSGLNCGGPDLDTDNGSLSLRRDMILDYVAGHSGCRDGARVCRVIVAGGGCARPHPPPNDFLKGSSSSSNNKMADMVSASLPIRELDLFLSELCASGVPVDYVPGLHDPTNANWPQRPLHPCLLPHAGTFVNMLNRAPNPYEAKIGGKTILGSDGLNIADLRRYLSNGKASNVEDGNAMEVCSLIDALDATLRFGHLCPTGPDSLPTIPCYDHDPFVMECRPDVYFAGNCSEFATRIVKHRGGSVTRLICVPSFFETGQVVLLNIKTLHCAAMAFDDSFDDDEKKSET